MATTVLLLTVQAILGEVNVEEVINRHLAATGGRERLEAVQSRVMRGHFSIPAMQLEAPVEMYLRPPDRLYVEIDFPGIGKVSNGVKGEVVWEINPMSGPRLLTGADRLSGLRQAQIDPFLNWKRHFVRARLEGIADCGDTSCRKMVLEPPEGEAISCYFEMDSGRLVHMSGSRDGTPVETELEDFREVDGFTLPFRIRIATSQFLSEITFDEIQHDVPLPEATFSLPESVRTLKESSR